MLGHESIDQTRKCPGIDLKDQDEPMKAQDAFACSIVREGHTTDTLAPSQRKWCGQRDLYARKQLARSRFAPTSVQGTWPNRAILQSQQQQLGHSNGVVYHRCQGVSSPPANGDFVEGSSTPSIRIYYPKLMTEQHTLLLQFCTIDCLTSRTGIINDNHPLRVQVDWINEASDWP